MELQECYRLLEMNESATDEEISRSYKRLAHLYHPDKNLNRIEWATRAMSNLNIAYTTVTGYRFSSAIKNGKTRPDGGEEHGPAHAGPKKTGRAGAIREELNREILTAEFVRYRELAKDALYKYFQYSLYNLHRRENHLNMGIFHKIVFALRKSYHNIKRLATLTRDRELIEHFRIFSVMIFSFYKSSECLNIPDSYCNLIDVEAFRLFKKGDDALHISHKELFYDRHNRSHFKREIAVPYLLKSEYYFREAMEQYPDSTWAVETSIKLEYVCSLKKYIELFFTGDTQEQ